MTGGVRAEGRKKPQQSKLAMNQPDDSFEHAADRAAKAVTKESGRAKSLALVPAGWGAPVSSETPPIVEQVLTESGQSLPGDTAKDMSRRFTYDFSRVRVHSNATAAESARAVNARAYTVGHHIVFNDGAFAPQTSAGRRLLAHELAHVVQQAGSKERVQRETYYAGGYKPFHKTIDQEIAAAKQKKWHPSTRDMAATASGSGGGEAVSTLDEFVKKLEGAGKGSITRLNLIGHSSINGFAFGGDISEEHVTFHPDATVTAEWLTKNASRVSALRDRFASGAKIVLYSCDAGTSTDLLNAIGSAFGACVEGFTSEVWWCITKDKDGNPVRGRVWAQNPHDPLPPDKPPDCNTLSPNVATLTTGGKSEQCGKEKKNP